MKNSPSRGNGNTRRSARGRGSARQDLTARQKLFALEYLKDLNATQAAIRAGYSARTAKPAASRLLTNVYLQAEIQKALDARAKRVEIDGDMVLQAIARQAFYDVRKFFDENGNAKEIHELDEQTADAVAGFEFVTPYEGSGNQKHAFGQLRKVKLADKRANRELLGRHLGLFKDIVESRKNECDGRSKEDMEFAAEHGYWPEEAATRGAAAAKLESASKAGPVKHKDL